MENISSEWRLTRGYGRWSSAENVGPLNSMAGYSEHYDNRISYGPGLAAASFWRRACPEISRPTIGSAGKRRTVHFELRSE